MADPFIAEIRIFAGNFAPRGWAFCNGQLVPITQNTALFSLLGTTYGGDGRNTFALPNLQGRVPIHPGQGPGLSLRVLGQSGGTQTVTLLPGEVASHSHPLLAQAAPGPYTSARAHSLATSSAGKPQFAMSPDTDMHADSLTDTGGGQPHNNMQPYLVVNYIIALQGVFPSRP